MAPLSNAASSSAKRSSSGGAGSSPQYSGKYYQGGGSGYIEDDARYRHIQEQKALEHLKTTDGAWFNKNYNGEMSSNGYLLDKSGKETTFLPSQNIGVGIQKVQDDARKQFAEEYPEDGAAYQNKEKTRTYENERNDPAYQAMQDRAAERSRARAEDGVTPESTKREERARAAKEFAQAYPEKAEEYAKRENNQPLKDAVEAKKKEAEGSAARRLSEDQVRQARSAKQSRFPTAVPLPIAPSPTNSSQTGSSRPPNARPGTGLPKTDGRTTQAKGQTGAQPIGSDRTRKQAQTLEKFLQTDHSQANQSDTSNLNREKGTSQGGPYDGAATQPSVLDGTNKNMYAPAESQYAEAGDGNSSEDPYDSYKAKNEKFQRGQQQDNARAMKFNYGEQEDPYAEKRDRNRADDVPPGDPNRPKATTYELAKRSADLLKRQYQLEQIKDATQRATKEKELADAAQGLGDATLHKVGISKNQVLEMGQRVATLVEAGSGFGLLLAAPVANLTAMNRYANSKILYFGYRSEEERAANPGTKYLDRLDVIIALIVDLIVTVYLLPVIAIIALLVLIVAVFVFREELGPILGTLVTQLTI